MEKIIADRLSRGSTKSGGNPGHLSSMFINELLVSGDLEQHIAKVLIPTYRSRSAALLQAIKESLVPLGVTISVGTPYEDSLKSGKDSAASQSNGTKNPLATVYQAGGFFTYLKLPSNLPPAADLATHAMSKYNLKFAFGGMFTIFGDDSSVERAKTGIGHDIRLCWSWHTEDELREGVRRIADVIKDFAS